MKDVQVNVKIELVKRRRKVRDLAAALGEEYTRVSRVLNGYTFTPDGWEARVQEVLARWDAQGHDPGPSGTADAGGC